MLEGLWAGQESFSDVAFPQSLRASACRPSVSWFWDSSEQDGLRAVRLLAGGSEPQLGHYSRQSESYTCFSDLSEVPQCHSCQSLGSK